MNLKEILEQEYINFCNEKALFELADPLQIAKNVKTPAKMLCCALFSYGNAKAIVKFLQSIDFNDYSKNKNKIYRFQSSKDIEEIFKTISKLEQIDIEKIFINSLNDGLEYGINELISCIYKLNPYRSAGYEFYFGKNFIKQAKSPYKRYNMWLRWLVRKTDIDLGIFKNIPTNKLILPLDTHTHKVSLALGLCQRKSYDFLAAKQITNELKNFDKQDPIKYDFALYRLGQSKRIKELLKEEKC